MRSSARGADRIILGCPEICVLVGPQHIDLPVFDSTLLQADAAVELSMAKLALHTRATRNDGSRRRSGIDLAKCFASFRTSS
jgi:aspartate racemase